jgi:hypothetical protein
MSQGYEDKSRSRGGNLCQYIGVNNADAPVPSLNRTTLAETAESFIHRLSANSKQSGDGALRETQLLTTLRLFNEQIGHLGKHGLVHQSDNTALSSFQLTKPGYQPPETDCWMSVKFWEELVPFKAKCPDRTDCLGRRDVGRITEHRYITQNRTRTHSGHDTPGRTVAPVDLDFAILDQVGGVGCRPFLEQMGSRVLGNYFTSRSDDLYVCSVQRCVVGPPKGPRQPIKMLLFGLTHPPLQPSVASLCSKRMAANPAVVSWVT